MRGWCKLVWLLPGLLLLGGCVNLGGGAQPPVVHYVLDDPGQAAPIAAPNPRTLLVMPVQAAGFYQSDALVFSRTPGTRAYYQYARWTEPPAQRLTQLILLRLERDKLFAHAAGLGSNLRGSWVLDAHLLDFYHEAEKPPGQVRIVLQARVVDLAGNTPVGQKIFRVSAPCPSYDAAGAYAAFDAATAMMLDQLTQWLAHLPPGPGRQP